MALIVEDGTGLADAESYLSVADLGEYAELFGRSYTPSSPESEDEAALRRATQWLDGMFRSRFPGARLNGRDQVLEWPRSGAYDQSGELIASNAVPIEIKNATAEAALREIASPGSLNPDYTPSQRVKRQRDKVDVLETEVEYFDSAAGAVIPIVTVIDEILSGIIGARSNTMVSFLERA
jgi:hypothetical protein